MDRIVYIVTDGDRNVTHATFDKDDAYATVRTSGTGAVQLTVRDPDKVAKTLLSKMTPVERLCIQNTHLTDDTVVYVTINNGGGVDGWAPSAKGGGIRFASFDRDVAERKVDGWSRFGEPIVVVPAEVAREKISALDPVTALCLEAHLEKLASKAAPRGPSR